LLENEEKNIFRVTKVYQSFYRSNNLYFVEVAYDQKKKGFQWGCDVNTSQYIWHALL